MSVPERGPDNRRSGATPKGSIAYRRVDVPIASGMPSIDGSAAGRRVDTTAAPPYSARTVTETDPHAASRMRHAAILRGLLAGLLLCEIAGQAGFVPSLLRGGLGTLLGLPFLAPSLLGAFVSQILLRPKREEVLASLAAAAALAWPLYSLVAADDHAAGITLLSALGLGTLLVLAARALTSRGEDRAAVLDVLLPTALLPAFVILAHPMVFVTAALWPNTHDHRLYLADAAFGAPLSFVVGRATAAVPLLPSICLAVYVALPLALMLVHTLRRRSGVRSGDTLVTFIALTVVGYFGYLLVPVAGPLYAFGPGTMSSA
jgi:hypothetical protein